MSAQFIASSPATPPVGKVALEKGARVRFLAAMPWAGVEMGAEGVVSDIWRGDDTVYWIKVGRANVIVDDYELWLLEPT